MKESRVAVIGGLSGLGFVVLGILNTFLYQQPPRIDSAPANILGWAASNRVGLSAGMTMGEFAALCFLVFAVYTQRRLNAVGSDFLGTIALVSGAGYAVVVTITSLPAATLVFMAGQRGGLTDGDVVRLLLDLYQILYAPATALVGVFLAAVGLAALWAGAFARWLGWLTLVVAVVCLVETGPAMVNSSYHPGPWAIEGWASAIGSLVVPLIMSIVILRRPLVAPGTGSRPGWRPDGSRIRSDDPAAGAPVAGD